MADKIRELEEHEQELTRLLDELGRVLGWQERLFEGERRRRNRARMEQITEEAQRPFEQLDQNLLMEGLERELQFQRERERYLRDVFDLLRQRRELEDLIFRRLERYICQEHRDRLFDELQDLLERREKIFGEIEFSSLEKTSQQLSEAADQQRALEGKLFELVERHLIQIHQSQSDHNLPEKERRQ